MAEHRRGTSVVPGATLIAIGTVMVLDRFFDMPWQKHWELGLVIGGAVVLAFDRRHRGGLAVLLAGIATWAVQRYGFDLNVAAPFILLGVGALFLWRAVGARRGGS